MRTNSIIIWYSEHQKRYFINNEYELKHQIVGFNEDYDTILYNMEPEQLKLATKIKNRLNEARELVASEV